MRKEIREKKIEVWKYFNVGTKECSKK